MIRHYYATPTHNPDGNRAVADFVSHIIWGEPGRIEKYSTMAVVDDGVLIAGVVFHNWDEDAGVMELTAASASPRWLTTPIIQAMHQFPFDLIGAQMVMHRVRGDNERMIRIHRKFGCHEVVIRRGCGRDTDCHVFTLTDDQWRAHPVALREKKR